jgi:hypothetical protein
MNPWSGTVDVDPRLDVFAANFDVVKVNQELIFRVLTEAVNMFLRVAL